MMWYVSISYMIELDYFYIYRISIAHAQHDIILKELNEILEN